MSEPTPTYDALLVEHLLASVEWDRVAADWQAENGWLS